MAQWGKVQRFTAGDAAIRVIPSVNTGPHPFASIDPESSTISDLYVLDLDDGPPEEQTRLLDNLRIRFVGRPYAEWENARTDFTNFRDLHRARHHDGGIIPTKGHWQPTMEDDNGVVTEWRCTACGAERELGEEKPACNTCGWPGVSKPKTPIRDAFTLPLALVFGVAGFLYAISILSRIGE